MHTILHNAKKNTAQILVAKSVKMIIQKKDRGRVEDNVVTHRPITRQRLGKYIPVGANPRINRTSVVRQRISNHT
jgi:hypothetical protein